jgi:hypothetical protein
LYLTCLPPFMLRPGNSSPGHNGWGVWICRILTPVCTENLIRIDYVTETPTVSAG